MGLFNWLRRRPPIGCLQAILIAEQAGETMRPIDEARALEGRGLAGDRYADDVGWWRATDGCQVTLIHAEHLARAERKFRIDLSDGRHRRNLVVTGLAHTDLRGKTLRIGDATFGWHRVRPPCGYLDKVSGRGTAKALGKHAGLCLRVSAPGTIRVGDPIRIETPGHPA
jgi:MOSC domain-containing protein YiiM